MLTYLYRLTISDLVVKIASEFFYFQQAAHVPYGTISNILAIISFFGVQMLYLWLIYRLSSKKRFQQQLEVLRAQGIVVQKKSENCVNTLNQIVVITKKIYFSIILSVFYRWPKAQMGLLFSGEVIYLAFVELCTLFPSDQAGPVVRFTNLLAVVVHVLFLAATGSSSLTRLQSMQAFVCIYAMIFLAFSLYSVRVIFIQVLKLTGRLLESREYEARVVSSNLRLQQAMSQKQSEQDLVLASAAGAALESNAKSRATQQTRAAGLAKPLSKKGRKFGNIQLPETNRIPEQQDFTSPTGRGAEDLPLQFGSESRLRGAQQPQEPQPAPPQKRLLNDSLARDAEAHQLAANNELICSLPNRGFQQIESEQSDFRQESLLHSRLRTSQLGRSDIDSVNANKSAYGPHNQPLAAKKEVDHVKLYQSDNKIDPNSHRTNENEVCHTNPEELVVDRLSQEEFRQAEIREYDVGEIKSQVDAHVSPRYKNEKFPAEQRIAVLASQEFDD